MFVLHHLCVLTYVFSKGKNTPCFGTPYEFHCDEVNNSCIFSYFRCDGIIDCPNGADEDPAISEADWAKMCERENRSSKFKPFKMATCNNTMCITECDLCDGYYLDCVDGSDEDPALCNGDNKPQLVGDCTLYRQSYPFPIGEPRGSPPTLSPHFTIP
ncbi:hypothetical protein HOLleu_06820 [Holothuria leucospilota]|uniref:Uncharacterized protein n=1 Tax=Holothuria leucospilota TaxID=206669 RepID=A0A9Q1HJ83_HOLLE|nr:hypothetical protein HOLleu_06820 [Holothuria leucospilota]